MSIEKTLNVLKRTSHGKGHNRRLRVEKVVPGVFYTAKGENISIQIPALPLQKMYNEVGRTTVFNLEIDDNGSKTIHPVLVWDAQYHPFKPEFKHVDFYGVDLDKPVKINVNIEFVGTAKGVKVGGRLETYREKVMLISKPLDMPKKITLDVTDMGLNSTIRVADLQLPEGVSASYDKNFAIVSIISKSDDADETDNI